MKQYACSVCGFIYDEAKGIPDGGIAPGTRWEELPQNWVCPLCGAAKSEFCQVGDEKKEPPKSQVILEQDSAEKALTPLEMSALCSNLARGCEKQYRLEDAKRFTELAAYFQRAAAPAEGASVAELLRLIDQDLNRGFPAASAAAGEAKDRGALRALVWSEKVTRILKSLLERYEKEGEAMLENTGVYVCTICGFLYIGDNPPALCPVCKVPSWKFEKIEGRAQ